MKKYTADSMYKQSDELEGRERVENSASWPPPVLCHRPEESLHPLEFRVKLSSVPHEEAGPHRTRGWSEPEQAPRPPDPGCQACALFGLQKPSVPGAQGTRGERAWGGAGGGTH